MPTRKDKDVKAFKHSEAHCYTAMSRAADEGGGAVMRDHVLEIAAALVDASIGYFSARSALMTAQRYLDGETTDWSERCLACFGGDLRQMVKSDLRQWANAQEERKRRVREFVKRTKDADWADATTASMFYPTTMV